MNLASVELTIILLRTHEGTELAFVSISRPSDCGVKSISNTVKSAKPTKHDIHFDLLLSSFLRFEANIFYQQ